MSVLDMLPKATKRKPDPSLLDKLSMLTIENDPGVISAVSRKEEALFRFEEARLTVESTTKTASQTEAAYYRTLRSGVSIGDSRELKARQERDEARLALDAAKAVVEGLASENIAAKVALDKARDEAAKTLIVELKALCSQNVIARNVLFEQLEALTGESLVLRGALETACPQVPIFYAPNFIAGYTRPLFASAYDVVLGLCPNNPLSFVQRIFKFDRNAPDGGTLASWRLVAQECGLLPTMEDEREKERKRQRRADQVVAAALKEDHDHRRINAAWGDTDRRDLSLK